MVLQEGDENELDEEVEVRLINIGPHVRLGSGKPTEPTSKIVDTTERVFE